MKKLIINLCLGTIICWVFPSVVFAILHWTDQQTIPGGNDQKASIYTELWSPGKYLKPQSQVYKFYGWTEDLIEIVLRETQKLTCEDPNVIEWTRNRYESEHDR